MYCLQTLEQSVTELFKIGLSPDTQSK